MAYSRDDRKNNDDTRSGRDQPKRASAERLGDASAQIAALDEKMPGLGARRAALDILMLLRRGRTLDTALSDCRTFRVLEGADRAFAFNLVSTTLRRRGSLDEIIGKYLDRPLPKNSSEVQDILRLATCQIVLLETPAHAAVGTAVELAAGKRETAGYKGLVNAITRKISRQGPALLEKLPPRSDTPGWLWRAWERQYGRAQTAAIAAVHQLPAPLDITARNAADAAPLLDLDGAQSLAPGHVRLSGQPAVTELPGFADGGWWVQDIAASLPVRLLGDVAGLSVFDLCAAPGGKTLQLAAAGARVTAVDQSGMRLKRLAENLERTGLSATTIKADVLDWEPDALADAILLDVPCSATGTIRRHPDVLWGKGEDEVRALARMQGDFIDRALGLLKPGGLLVYCVCSLQREEGEDQMRSALSRHEGLELVAVTPDDLPFLPAAVSRDGALRTLPSMKAEAGGMDGFFACRLRKAEQA